MKMASLKDNRPAIWISVREKKITWYNKEGNPSRVKKFKSDKEMEKYIQLYWKEKIKG
jgi:hypothetical protein